jgi:hypothetical protein
MKSVIESPMSEGVRQPAGQRSFSLNSPEAYEALCDPVDRPWIPNGALPREPHWPRGPAAVPVMAESRDDASEVFRSWLAYLGAGRIGSRDAEPETAATKK